MYAQRLMGGWNVFPWVDSGFFQGNVIIWFSCIKDPGFFSWTIAIIVSDCICSHKTFLFHIKTEVKKCSLSLYTVEMKGHPNGPVILYIFLGLVSLSKYAWGYYKCRLLVSKGYSDIIVKACGLVGSGFTLSQLQLPPTRWLLPAAHTGLDRPLVRHTQVSTLSPDTPAAIQRLRLHTPEAELPLPAGACQPPQPRRAPPLPHYAPAALTFAFLAHETSFFSPCLAFNSSFRPQNNGPFCREAFSDFPAGVRPLF